MALKGKDEELPFSARYSLPLHIKEGLGEVSWETVAKMSSDFQIRIDERQQEVRKVLKELQMSRLLLMDRIKQGSHEGKIDPKLLVDAVRLLQRCEEVSEKYEIDLREFSSFIYLISEKLKREKLARHAGTGMLGVSPIKDELDSYKAKSEKKKERKNGRR